MEKGEKLSGKLVDAYGRTGTIEMMVIESNTSMMNWKLTILERKSTQTVEGQSMISQEGDSLAIKPIELEKESIPPWSASLKKCDAGRYAEFAYIGEYQIQQGKENPLMSRGVIVLWKFK